MNTYSPPNRWVFILAVLAALYGNHLVAAQAASTAQQIMHTLTLAVSVFAPFLI